MSRDAFTARGTGEAPGPRAIPRAKARAAASGLRSEGARNERLNDEGAGSGLKRAGAIGASTALLFVGYLRVSWTVPATSDGAAQALQARAMLAGNWLLHGWTLSDVSFYTTELPEYVLVEVVRPFGLSVIHVAAALTYTLLVLVSCALARGRSAGREGLLQALLTGVIMLAPQLGYGAFVLLLSPDHTGTELPLLLGWLLLDLAPRRWWVPAIVCLLLAVVQFSDRVAVLTAVLPLVVVCAVVVARGLVRRRGRECRFELALMTAAIASIAVAWAGARLLEAAGGFAGHPFSLTLAPLSQLWTHTWLTGWGILELYGANFLGLSGPAGFTFAALHLIGLTLAIAAVAVALWRFIRPRGQTQLLESVLAVAVVANLLSYLLSTSPGTVLGTGYDAREIAAVLPMGAVLAGRVFGPPLARRSLGWAQRGGRAGARVRSRTSVFIAFVFLLVMAGYGAAFGYSASQPGAPGQYSALSGWLVAHGLRYGLGQSSSNVATVDSGGRAEVEPVIVGGGRVRALLYQSSAAAFDPRLHDANFLVSQAPGAASGEAGQTVPDAAVRATFGPPARTYRFDGYTVLVWNVNLLTRMAG